VQLTKSVHPWLKAAPPQVASPPQEAPVQVRVWVPVPQVVEQADQPLKVPFTGLLVPVQEPPEQESGFVHEFPSLQEVPFVFLFAV
jgi:hypothetical protein